MHFRTLVATILVSLTAAVASAESPEAFPVFWKVPANWKLVGRPDKNNVAVYQYSIEGTAIGAHASAIPRAFIMVFRDTKRGMWGDKDDKGDAAALLANLNATQVAVGADNEDWKTYLLASHHLGGPTIEVVRFGESGGVGVELVVSFPLVVLNKSEKFAILTPERSTVTSPEATGLFLHPSSATELTDAFNAVCDSLKVSGNSSCLARLTLVEPPKDARFFVPDDGGKP